MYGLSNNREAKMAGCRPSFFFFCVDMCISGNKHAKRGKFDGKSYVTDKTLYLVSDRKDKLNFLARYSGLSRAGKV